MNPFTLQFRETRIQKQYELDLKEHSIKYSKILLSVLVAVFGTYVIKNLVGNQSLSNIAQLFLLFASLLFLILMNFPRYKNIHYKYISFLIGFLVFLKILFDWRFTDYNKPLSGIFVPLISCMTIHLKINFVQIVCYNLFFVISFSLRFFLILLKT